MWNWFWPKNVHIINISDIHSLWLVQICSGFVWKYKFGDIIWCSINRRYFAEWIISYCLFDTRKKRKPALLPATEYLWELSKSISFAWFWGGTNPDGIGCCIAYPLATPTSCSPSSPFTDVASIRRNGGWDASWWDSSISEAVTLFALICL